MDQATYAMADQRAKDTEAVRAATVNSQVQVVGCLLDMGVPSENVLRALETMLMSNLRKR